MKTVTAPALNSTQLIEGRVYTRMELKKQFNIIDATLNTGVFQLAGSNSVWLFVTETKSSDRTPYRDLLQADTLFWQGQMKGRTDKLIISHYSNNRQLLVFYRKRKYEHPGAGFRFEGRFSYQSHTGEHPTSFILRKTLPDNAVHLQNTELKLIDDFNPIDIKDGQTKILASIVRRRGQATFRAQLLEAYSRTCAVTGCNLEAVLEAAHIIPYMGDQTNHVQNGILLRADIHTLFDLHLITISPDDYTVLTSPELEESNYAYLAGKTVCIPDVISLQPSREALQIRQSQFFVKNKT